jgi:tRNA-modifying protein YgfZ
MTVIEANDHYHSLEILGSDAMQTLQGQFTCDVIKQAPNTTIPGLLCSLKGRVEIIGYVHKHSPEHFSIIVPAPDMDALAARLKPYLMFSRSKMAPSALSTHALVMSDTPNPPDATPHKFHLSDQIGLIADDTCAASISASATPSRLTSLRLRSGLLELNDRTRARFTPQQLSLDVLGYVSFTKGCYMGQEIIARIHYKGAPKTRLALLEWRDRAETPSNHSLIDAKGNTVGEILESNTELSLATVSTELPVEALLEGDNSHWSLSHFFHPQ